jgi:ribosomal protein L28
MNIHLTAKSTNKKTGPIPVSTSPRKTCPSTCPFKDAGCYADGGPLRYHWEGVSKGLRGFHYDRFLEEIRKLPTGQLWRHNQAGDLIPDPRDSLKIGEYSLRKLVKANIGRRGFTYTHYPIELDSPDAHRETRRRWYDNLYAVNFANKNGFTINLSANSIQHADKLIKLDGLAPVTTTLPSDWKYKKKKSPDGYTIVTCPAVIRENKTCLDCGMCAMPERKTIIGFPAHGFRKSHVDRFMKIVE